MKFDEILLGIRFGLEGCLGFVVLFFIPRFLRDEVWLRPPKNALGNWIRKNKRVTSLPNVVIDTFEMVRQDPQVIFAAEGKIEKVEGMSWPALESIDKMRNKYARKSRILQGFVRSFNFLPAAVIPILALLLEVAPPSDLASRFFGVAIVFSIVGILQHVPINLHGLWMRPRVVSELLRREYFLHLARADANSDITNNVDWPKSPNRGRRSTKTRIYDLLKNYKATCQSHSIVPLSDDIAPKARALKFLASRCFGQHAFYTDRTGLSDWLVKTKKVTKALNDLIKLGAIFVALWLAASNRSSYIELLKQVPTGWKIFVALVAVIVGIAGSATDAYEAEKLSASYKLYLAMIDEASLPLLAVTTTETSSPSDIERQ